MVNEFEEYLDRIFHALADQTRRHILERLAERDLGIAEIASTYNMSLVAVSKHVKVLEKAGLVLTSKEGRVTRCIMRFEPLEPASQQIEFYKQFWRDHNVEGLTKLGTRQERKKIPRGENEMAGKKTIEIRQTMPGTRKTCLQPFSWASF